MARAPIVAAGGIVVRGGREPTIAVVQLRRRKDWMLPKGKLTRGESIEAAARREAMEETGQNVAMHEFLGTLSYEVGRKPKIVQFWRMEAVDGPQRKLARDVRDVKWLPLDDAIRTLSHPREQFFLLSVGPAAVRAARQSAPRKSSGRSLRLRGGDIVNRIRSWWRDTGEAKKKRKR